MFITFEGGEGAGKSTQIALLADCLRDRGESVIATREPGGSPGAEAVRHVLLSGAAEEFGIRMEALLFAAARSDHVEERIRPAVEAGTIVLCDRFMDSTRVYQGVTGNLEPRFLTNLERIAVNGMVPDLTIILDLPAEIGLDRARRRAGAGGADAPSPDRYERETLAIHEMRRDGFRELAEREPQRCRLVDANRSAASVAADVKGLVLAALADHSGTQPAGLTSAGDTVRKQKRSKTQAGATARQR